jgi:hypothetical protein
MDKVAGRQLDTGAVNSCPDGSKVVLKIEFA